MNHKQANALCVRHMSTTPAIFLFFVMITQLTFVILSEVRIKSALGRED